MNEESMMPPALVPAPAADGADDRVYAVLIAIAGDTLLLPNAAVAEVLGGEPLAVTEAMPAGLRGHLDWNGRRVPVLCFEQLNPTPPGESRRERLIVLHTPGRHLPGAHLAIVAQAYPHLLMLREGTAQPLPLREGDRDDLVLARLRIGSQEALIPDLEGLEAELSRLSAA